MTALIPWVALATTMAVTGSRAALELVAVFGVLTLITAIFHPSGRAVLSSFGVSRADRVLLALVATAAVPALTLASTNVWLQRTGAGSADSDHAALGHYALVGASGITIVGAGVLAGLRPDGWRVPAWVAGLLAGILGFTSLVYPDADSALPPGWAVASLTWGVGFLAVAEITQDGKASTRAPFEYESAALDQLLAFVPPRAPVRGAARPFSRPRRREKRGRGVRLARPSPNRYGNKRRGGADLRPAGDV